MAREARTVRFKPEHFDAVERYRDKRRAETGFDRFSFQSAFDELFDRLLQRDAAAEATPQGEQDLDGEEKNGPGG